MGQLSYDAITVLGNCQANVLSVCLRRMMPNCTVEFVRYFSDWNGFTSQEAKKNHLLLVQQPIMSFNTIVEEAQRYHQIVEFPSIVHNGFHPDLIRPKIKGGLIQGPMGSNHSAIALFSYLRGLDVAQAEGLYCEDVYRLLGYFDARRQADGHLRNQFSRFGLAETPEFVALLNGSCFMHNTLHPKLHVIAILARSLLAKVGIEPNIRFPENLMSDEFSNNVVWPIYPEIAEHFGITGGEYIFQFKPTTQRTFDLPSFLAASFDAYSKVDVGVLSHSRLQSAEMEVLETWCREPKRSVKDANPYRSFPDHQFWRRSVASHAHGDIDPVASQTFKLERDDRIGTAGSCFAQHIARRLAASGHRYYVTETGEDLDDVARTEKNYGVYSARYGNIYTPRQLLQLFQRAYGDFVPDDIAWRRHDGRYVDPFRPEIESDGFASLDEVVAARKEHLAAVRELFQNVDVLIFTLGLTEAWQSKSDSAVFPVCPMVVTGFVDPARYEAVNFGYEEVLQDILLFMQLLRGVNPSAKVLLTISPVPLIATFEKRHVLISTTASKAILRSAADAACRADPRVSYFPSYEIIANPYFERSYFDPDDRRSVLPEGVDHVMRVFMQHFSQLGPTQTWSELSDEQRVVCEEERLDPRSSDAHLS